MSTPDRPVGDDPQAQPDGPTRTATMSLDEAILSRRSVRAFLPQEVPEDTLREVLELARWAPSNCNVQPWIPHVVSGDALQRLRAELVRAGLDNEPVGPDFPSAGKFKGVYRERQVDAARVLYGAMGVERGDLQARHLAYVRNQDFFGAPHVMFIFLDRDHDIREAADVGIYTQTLMLAFTSRGVATCAQGAVSLFPAIIRRHLGLDERHRLLFGVSFGYPDPDHPANAARVGRASVGEIVHHHR